MGGDKHTCDLYTYMRGGDNVARTTDLASTVTFSDSKLAPL